MFIHNIKVSEENTIKNLSFSMETLFPKNKVFFSTEGRTATSANYLANKAKEYYTELEQEIGSASFINRKVTLIGGQGLDIGGGADKEWLDSLDEKIDKIGMCKALIAWLREAIKAKEEQDTRLDFVSLEDWANDRGIKLPLEPERRKPAERLDEDGVVAQMSVKERNEGFWLGAVVTNIGKLIHPDGAISRARKSAMELAKRRFSVSGEGSQTTVTEYIPSVPLSEIDAMFMRLQEKHRSLQARLNGYANLIEEKVRDSKAEADYRDYVALGEYNAEMERYEAEMSSRRAEFAMWKEKEAKELKSLKIVIPDDLAGIVHELESIGK